MQPELTFARLPMPELLSGRGGRPVLLRAVRATDLALLEAFINGLSPASRRRRFHGAVKALPQGMLQRMVQPDPRHELALVAMAAVSGQQACIGEARYALSDGPPSEREFALVVADAWQGAGLGTAMLHGLARHARARGVERLVGDVMRDNAAMIEWARRNGCSVRTHPTDARLLRVTRELRDGRGADIRHLAVTARQSPGRVAQTPPDAWR